MPQVLIQLENTAPLLLLTNSNHSKYPGKVHKETVRLKFTLSLHKQFSYVCSRLTCAKHENTYARFPFFFVCFCVTFLVKRLQQSARFVFFSCGRCAALCTWRQTLHVNCLQCSECCISTNYLSAWPAEIFLWSRHFTTFLVAVTILQISPYTRTTHEHGYGFWSLVLSGDVLSYTPPHPFHWHSGCQSHVSILIYICVCVHIYIYIYIYPWSHLTAWILFKPHATMVIWPLNTSYRKYAKYPSPIFSLQESMTEDYPVNMTNSWHRWTELGLTIYRIAQFNPVP